MRFLFVVIVSFAAAGVACADALVPLPQSTLPALARVPQSTLPALRVPEPVAPPAEPAPLSYGDAYRESLRTGRPLLVWVGGNFCERCVNDSADEFIHHFTASWPGAPVPSVVVAVPEGDGLTRLDTLTRWIEGDATFGHLPSVRRIIEGAKARKAAPTRPQGGWGGAANVGWSGAAAPMRSGKGRGSC